MKRLLAVGLTIGLLSGSVHAVPQYVPQSESTQSSGGGRTNIVPVVAITGVVLAVGYTIFKVHKVKQVRAARFNVYVANGGN